MRKNRVLNHQIKCGWHFYYPIDGIDVVVVVVVADFVTPTTIIQQMSSFGTREKLNWF